MGTFSDLVANSWLDAVARAVAYSEAEFWVKLHLGDPGAAGTANPAVETTRKQVTFGSAATGRAISNTAAVEWLNVSTTETYTWVSFWDASTAGNFLGRDDLSASAAVTAGDTFRIPIGDLDLSVV
jgi:hypothetical protein